MPHPRVYGSEAIVLRRTDFGESDRILTLFTPTYGKVRAIAKGVRRTTSRLAGHLESFTRTQLLLATGRDLDIVTQAEARERLDALRADLWHATGAWYVAELVDRFLEDADPHPQLYAAFIATLRRLEAGAKQHAEQRPHDILQSWLALRYFELRLLDELGFRPSLHHCTGCDMPLRPEENGFSAEMGGVLCPKCSRYSQRRLSLQALKVLRLLQTTEWEALPRLRLEPALQAEIEGVLQSCLRYHLDRDLKAWSFLHSVAGQPSSE
ncbi:MAG TPA: DNA repair protein RecO [Ktedonobacterales bacterium]